MHELLQMFFPYCLSKEKNNEWTLLNRSYKPLGFNTKNFETYSGYPILFMTRKIRFEKLQKLSYKPIEKDCDRIYLYSDSCVPTRSKKYMDQYLEKLSILMKISIMQSWEKPVYLQLMPTDDKNQ